MRTACNLVEGWKRYKIVLITVVILVTFITSTWRNTSNDRYQAKDLPILTRKANLTSNTQHDNTQMVISREWTLGLNASEKRNQSTVLTLSTLELPKFNESFRNPCWYDKLWYKQKATLRCFPYFYLAGFPKCGTTDLYFKIASHPLVISGIRKETHYLDRQFFNAPHDKCSSHFHCGSIAFSIKYFTKAARMISMTRDTKLMNSTFLTIGKSNRPSRPQVTFIKHFPQESMAIWREGQKVKKYPGIIVDASASTAWEYSNFRQITENQAYGFPRNTTADWIHKIYPGTKIIMILRNPVARAFSDYKMHLRWRASVTDFHQRVQDSTQRIEECLQSGKPALLCATYTYKARLHIGLYYYHIKSWFEKFPREQILILRFEDYKASIPKTLIKVFKFLDLPAINQEGLEFISGSQTLNVARIHGKMLPETKNLLTNFYKPFNEKLAHLLGDDRFLWK